MIDYIKIIKDLTEIKDLLVAARKYHYAAPIRDIVRDMQEEIDTYFSEKLTLKEFEDSMLIDDKEIDIEDVDFSCPQINDLLGKVELTDITGPCSEENQALSFHSSPMNWSKEEK